MKVALDAQLLFEEQKTGIGWNAVQMIDELTRKQGENYELNYFYLKNLWKKGKSYEREIIKKYEERGCRIYRCGFFKTVLYYLTRNCYPLPYRFYFRNTASVIQFFNFVIPQKVEIPTITYVHDMAYKACTDTVEEKTRKILESQLPRTCQNCARIIAISEFTKKEIMKYLHVPEEKIRIVNCGISQKLYQSKISDSQRQEILDKFRIEGNYLLYVGTLEPRKNIGGLVEAYEKLQRQMPDCPKLVLAGKRGWMYEEIYDKIKHYGLEKQVIMTGYLTEDEKVALMQGAKVFLFPSSYEGFGIPPAEAMACGIPVVASNTASMPEVVGEGGLLVPPENTEEIADAVKKLLTDQRYYEDMARKAKTQAAGFTWERAADRLRGVYMELERERKEQDFGRV